MASRYPEYGQLFKFTAYRKKNAGVNSLPIRENANIANFVSSLSTEEEESTLESFFEIIDLETGLVARIIGLEQNAEKAKENDE
ncbi:1709_t:CDS:2 [Entrophospora sp. SA101]|nr:5217_t:CDS:2 [Entrophospora sp. SA101]CAJ0766305.1 1709_t:CDS:2 [Entrophospora sp. SA101]